MEAGVFVLTREENQAIVIGGDITVRVLSITESKVRLGIDAPRHVSVLREEKIEENEAARE
jgi:carbon storage regulator